MYTLQKMSLIYLNITKEKKLGQTQKGTPKLGITQQILPQNIIGYSTWYIPMAQM